MEYEGVTIDTDFLNDYSKELEKEAKQRKKVYTASRCSF